MRTLSRRRDRWTDNPPEISDDNFVSPRRRVRTTGPVGGFAEQLERSDDDFGPFVDETTTTDASEKTRGRLETHVLVCFAVAGKAGRVVVVVVVVVVFLLLLCRV